MRICLVSQEYPPGYVGGIGTQTRVKAQGLLALRSRGRGADGGRGGRSAAGEARRRRRDVSTPCARRAAGSPCTAPRRTGSATPGPCWPRCARCGEQRPFDVVDFPDYAAEGLAYQLDRTEEEPTAVVVHLHGSLGMFSEQIGWPPADDPLLRIGRFMEDISIEQADSLLAASRSIAELTCARLELDPGRIDVVAGAVDSELFAPAPALASNGRGPRLLFVGNLVANKGVGDRARGLHPPRRRAPGAHADDRRERRRRRSPAELLDRAAQAGVGERVELLGFVEHRDLPGAVPRRRMCSPRRRATRAASASSTSRRWRAGCRSSRRRPAAPPRRSRTARRGCCSSGATSTRRPRRSRRCSATPGCVPGWAQRAASACGCTSRQAPYAEKVSRAYERAIERRRRSRLAQTA